MHQALGDSSFFTVTIFECTGCNNTKRRAQWLVRYQSEGFGSGLEEESGDNRRHG